MLLTSLPQLFYLFLYFFFLTLTMCSSDFISLWIFIELMTLLFIILMLSAVSSTVYSPVLIYFLIQSFSSIGLLFCFLLVSSLGHISTFSLLFLIFLLLNLGIAPFNFWYFFSLIGLPNLSFFLALSFQKLPPFLLFSYFFNFFSLPSLLLLIFSFVTTLLSSSTLAISSVGLNSILIVSSIFNSSWILAISLVSFPLFLCYFAFYSLILFAVLFSTFYISISLYTLIGLPPFPLFFLKFTGAYLMLSSIAFGTFTFFILFIILVTNVAILVLYYSLLSSNIILAFSNSFSSI